LALREHWKEILVLAASTLFIFVTGTNLQSYYGTAYLVARGVSNSFATFSAGVGSAVGSIFLIVGSITGDIIGRKKTYLISLFLMFAAVLAYVPLLSTLNPAFIISAQIFEQSVAGIGIATISVLFAEYFPTKFRYSGAGLSFQVGALFNGIVGAFLLPVIIASAGGIVPSAPYVILLCVVAIFVSLACIVKIRETKGDKMAL
jgi:MFS family permease